MAVELMLDDVDDPAVRKFLELRKMSTTPTKPCGCGCGRLIPALRKDGRPRLYIKGHKNRHPEGGRHYRRNFWIADADWQRIIAAADGAGESASAYIRTAVRQRMEGR